MTDDEAIEFERLKTARDGLLLTVANLRGQLETIAAHEREACWNIIFEYAGRDDITLEDESLLKHLADLIRASGQA